MWLLRVFGVIYLITVCAAQQTVTTFDYGDSLTTVQTATAYKAPVPVLLLQTSWYDVFPSEKVELRCSISNSENSEWTFSWYRDDSKITSDGSSVLTVTADPQKHGSYFCEGKHKTKGVVTERSQRMELKVYPNKPKPTLSRSSSFGVMYPGESIEFSCTVNPSSGWEYVWYHNGKEIQVSHSNTYKIPSIAHDNSGDYYCKAKRGKDPFYTDASESTNLDVSDPPTPVLKLLTQWADVFEGETVDLSCEVSRSVHSHEWMFTWYRRQQELHKNSNLEIYENGSKLKIKSISQANEGDYECMAKLSSRNIISGFSNSHNIIVHDTLPKPSLTKKPGFHSMYVGESVTVTCSVLVSSGWRHQWYKDGKSLPGTSETLSFTLDHSYKGEYHCKATRSTATSTRDSNTITLNVLEIPVPSLELKSKWLHVFPTESVKMSCRLQQSDSDWKYTWKRDGVEVQAVDSISFGSDAAILSISSASSGHSGRYTCEGHLQGRTVRSSISSELFLQVYDKKPTLTLEQSPNYKVMFAGENVFYSCNINVASEWEYSWYKNEILLESPSESTYSFSLDGTTNSGEYKCRATRAGDPVFTTEFSNKIPLEVNVNKPKPLIAQQPDVQKLYVGENVSFHCSVDISSGWAYHWYKDGVEHSSSTKTLTITSVSLPDRGTYDCMAIRERTKFQTEHSNTKTLNIAEIPVPSLTHETKWLDVFPNETVSLSCKMDQDSSEWSYTWYRDKDVQAENQGTELTFSASASHRGDYTCSGKLKSRPVISKSSPPLILNVYDEKPKVTLVQDPKHEVMHTGDSVSFSCHINVSSGWEYRWYKNGTPLPRSGNNHTIRNVATADTGDYTCKAGRGKTFDTKTENFSFSTKAMRIEIRERPQASIELLTGWSEVFSTDSLVLRCEVKESQDKWNYTWSKEGAQNNLTSGERYIVTPQNDLEQGEYTCKGVRIGRPSYSKTSESFKTKNLLLKRRVLLSISGCIFFGIVVVLIGCIVLRAVRKPANNDEKPEEANLFVSMTQQKMTDMPCPLVEYITDAALNAPPKEEEEDGTICSETTPLPITTPEDQAVTTDHSATETNGGLVSFQQ
ncbi:Fc receptor-like protein 5 [Pholidichthys leucotaenia]